MKRTLYITLIFCCVFKAKAQQNLILNGSFENNNATNHIGNLSNAQYNSTIAFSTSFGQSVLINFDGEIDLLKTGGGYLSWAPTWTVKAQEGDWFIVPAAMGYTWINGNNDTILGYLHQDAFSLELYDTLSTGSWYTLSYYSKFKTPAGGTHPYAPGRISVGMSHYADSFGVIIDTSSYTDTAWTQHSVHFQATSNFRHITCRPIREQIGFNWPFLDNFVLHFDSIGTYIPPVSINEIPQQIKTLHKVVDVLGRETKPKKNTPLFYIYENGTVEKRIIIE